MTVCETSRGKERFLPLFLVGDEQEEMIFHYLDRGRLFVLLDNGVKAVAVVTDEGGGVCEVKNLSVKPEFQRMGYGTALLKYLMDLYRSAFHTMRLGTGESPATLAFYRHLGFRETGRVRNHFLTNYDHPIVENGVRLRDMVCLSRDLRREEGGKC